LTTNLTGGTIRVRIKSRDKLEKESEICINEIRTLDLSRIELTSLTTPEMEEVVLKLSIALGRRH